MNAVSFKNIPGQQRGVVPCVVYDAFQFYCLLWSLSMLEISLKLLGDLAFVLIFKIMVHVVLISLYNRGVHKLKRPI